MINSIFVFRFYFKKKSEKCRNNILSIEIKAINERMKEESLFWFIENRNKSYRTNYLVAVFKFLEACLSF